MLKAKAVWHNILFGILILVQMANFSCDYHYYSVRDTNGVKHRLREYTTLDRQERYDCKQEIRHRYRKTIYQIDSNYLSHTDSTIDCGSIVIRLLPDSRQYMAVFTKGLITCKQLQDACPDEQLTVVDISTGKIVTQSGKRVFFIRDLSQIRFVKSGIDSRLFKFKITPYLFYFELANSKVNARASFDEFINGATLTWFYKSVKVEI